MYNIILTLGYCGPTDCAFDTTVNGIKVSHGIESDSWFAFSKVWWKHRNVDQIVITPDHPEYEKLLSHHNNPNTEYD